MIIDIDHFKLVNDVFGHLQGDMVIRRIASILARNCRGTDILLRYEGDEFVIVMPVTEQLKAVNQAERILQGLTKEVFSEGMEIGLSIGVAESRPEDTNLSQTLVRADKALYEAKKGGRGRVSFYRNSKTENTRGKISFEHFVGREQELSTLRNILNETVTGKGQFTLISGEPGIGKNRLAKELEHYSSFKDCLFLETECDELGTEKPYRRLTEPMSQLLTSFSKNDLRNLSKTLPSILPQTAELFPTLNLKLSKAPSTDEEGVVKFGIYSEISSILGWIASIHPVVFAVKNLQWISANDFDLLAYLVRANMDAPILFLSTMRTPQEDFPKIRKKLRILSCLVRFTSIKLEELDEEYTKHMLMFALRDPKIPQDVLQRLAKQSNGNPLHLKELLLFLRNNNAIELRNETGWTYKISDELLLPETLSQLMSARLEELENFTREILCTGSLMPGGSFSPGPISEVLHRNEFDIAKALEKPLRLKLIHEKSSQSNTLEYQFIHNTLRGYLLQEISQETRKALQSRFGLYYEGIYNKGNTGILPLLAHHYCDSLNSARAMHFALLAWKHANERDAKRDALRWLEQYISLTDDTIETNQNAFHARIELGKLYTHFASRKKAANILKEAARFATDKSQIGLLRFQEAHLHFNMGEYSTANDLYLAAIEFLPPGKDRILAAMQIAFIQFLSVSEARGLELLRNTLGSIQSIADKREKKQLLATYCMRYGTIALKTLTRLDSTRECLKAVTIYRQLRDKIGEAKALLNTAVSLQATGKYEARIDILNDALKVLTQTGDTYAVMGTYVNLGQACYNAMEYDPARDYFQRCLCLVEATGTKKFGVWANSYLAILDTNDKDFSSAEIKYRKAIESADELGLAPMALNARMNLATLLINKKDFEQANIQLTWLETDELIKTMDSATIKTLQGYRGTERLLNTAIERPVALKQAETNLRNATTDTGEKPSLRTIDLLGTLSECLHEQNKLKEAGQTLSRAQNMFRKLISGIDSKQYRQKILDSSTAKKLSKLSKRLEPLESE